VVVEYCLIAAILLGANTSTGVDIDENAVRIAKKIINLITYMKTDL